MKRTILTVAICTLALLVLSQIGTGQQPPPIPPAPGADAPVPPVLQNYRAVTAERLKKPEDGDWLSVRRTYDGWGYSPLDQVKRGNVDELQLKWVLLTGQNNGHEAPPMVNNGVMFVSTPGYQVLAVDAKTGRQLWRYARMPVQGARVLHQTTRGLALYGDKVYFAAGDAFLIALDAKTGREVWNAKVGDTTLGYYMSLAPLAADGKIMVGVSGGENGIRGYVAAYDPESGKELWRTYTVPAPGEPGSETWPNGDQWKTGGGSVWVTGNYDPETNLAFWGVGNGGPWMGDQRPGDNLYTASTIAIDAATGKIKGHFQYSPNESWDWDEVSPPILVDFRRNGRTIKGLIDVARNGYLYFLERSDSKISFIEGMPYVRQNVFKGLDPKTGRPDVDPEHKPGTGKAANYCPGLSGGKNWPPIAFSPDTRMIYIPANENICSTLTGQPITYSPARGFSGAQIQTAVVPGATHFGEVQAWNVDTGKKVWTHTFATSHNWGPMLTTGGDLVFTGGTNDQLFRAFDARNGRVLWQYPTNSGILGQPTSFSIEGKQYIAVMSGWGVDARGVQGTLTRGLAPGLLAPVPEGGSIWVFGLEN